MIKTPKGGIITITDEFVLGSQYMVSCLCSICSNDKEMYPDQFIIRKSHLKTGIIPCGCSVKPKISELQAKIRVKRILKSGGYGFLGYDGKYKNAKSKFKFSCKIHGVQSRTFDALTQGCGCIKCGKTNKIDFDDATLKMKLIIENSGFEYIGFDGGKYLGNKTAVSYICKRHGIQSSSYDYIFNNSAPCSKCNGKYQYSMEEKSELAKTKCSYFGYKFLKLIGNNKNADMKINYVCDKGHYVKSSFSNFLYKNTKCPICNPRGYDKNKSGYFYIFEYKHKNIPISVYKFGITNRNPITRGKEHIHGIDENHIETNRLLYKKKFLNGEVPQNIERYINSHFKTGVVDWLTSGNTETIKLDIDSLNIITQYVEGLKK